MPRPIVIEQFMGGVDKWILFVNYVVQNVDPATSRMSKYVSQYYVIDSYVIRAMNSTTIPHT